MLELQPQLKNKKIIQDAVHLDPSTINHAAENKAKALFLRVFHVQEVFWKEKAYIKWFQDNDRNTEYFHMIVNVRNSKNKIIYLHVGESMISDKDDLNFDVVTSLFT